MRRARRLASGALALALGAAAGLLGGCTAGDGAPPRDLVEAPGDAGADAPAADAEAAAAAPAAADAARIATVRVTGLTRSASGAI